MMGGKKKIISGNGSIIVQNRPENGDSQDDSKLQQMKEREKRVQMREALGFEANPEANEPAPAAKEAKPGDRERRSRTTNKDREDRQKKYEELIGEFTEK